MKAVLLTLTILLTAACAHHPTEEQVKAEVAPKVPPPPTAGASIEAKEVAAEGQDPYVTEFKFAKGKSSLGPTDQARLKKFLTEAAKHGEITDIKVISWADMEYPSVHTKHLSKSQVTLAKSRGDDLETRVHAFDSKLKIEKLNMAERPNMFSDWLGTADARVKKSLEVAGIPNTDTSVKTPAKASRAIILVRLKASHG